MLVVAAAMVLRVCPVVALCECQVSINFGPLREGESGCGGAIREDGVMTVVIVMIVAVEMRMMMMVAMMMVMMAVVLVGIATRMA